jgi:hypothetical protein
MPNFQQRLKSLDIEPEWYLRIVRELAEEHGYSPYHLSFSDRIDKKLMLRHKGRTIHFGASPYQDYILLNFQAQAGLISERQCEEVRERYLKRATRIKGSWTEDPFSPNYLSMRILWAYEL